MNAEEKDLIIRQHELINSQNEFIKDLKTYLRISHAFMIGAIVQDGYKPSAETLQLYNEFCKDCGLDTPEEFIKQLINKTN